MRNRMRWIFASIAAMISAWGRRTLFRVAPLLLEGFFAIVMEVCYYLPTMARTIIAIFVVFLSFSCAAAGDISFARVGVYSEKIIALGEKTTDLGAEVDRNMTAGVTKETTGLELLLALQNALPFILARRNALEAPASQPSRE